MHSYTLEVSRPQVTTFRAYTCVPIGSELNTRGTGLKEGSRVTSTQFLVFLLLGYDLFDPFEIDVSYFRRHNLISPTQMKVWSQHPSFQSVLKNCVKIENI